MNMKLNMNKQQGFTLIELVMVIVILGILAATALPKFADMQNQARISTLQGALGSVRAAIAIVHSQALAQNKTGAADATQTITLEDGSAVLLAYGYPIDISKALNLSTTDFTATATSITLNASSTADKLTCAITYTPASSLPSALVTTGTATADITPVGTIKC